ncbi:MAG: peptide chain release factor 2 [Candidatus Pacebacteria bacterium]|nr:peptide chain release factor 2 [Candidatus Paceibacterota bacterium]MDD3072250.1 peptide chain release factor 2 [Candidatus Paceibacterota bacterium]MDD3729141.1 peptide chain release factor 2 [Candidatus Paceibacterota bacterium]MDD4201207.1 peptide chain release factor 2 [Candidatus Paceibacterota bacterium]MDD4466868.1 peptide chain release factor 2 [Candidatus Paceibacterota bacterium]
MEKKKKRLLAIEEESQKKDFWEDSERAKEISKEIADLKEEIDRFDFLEKKILEIEEAMPLFSDREIALEAEENLSSLEKDLEEEEFKAFLSGRYDKNNAVLQIYSGAGGADAQDWAAMLFRMYERYCSYKGWKAVVIDQSFGEGVGQDNRIGLKSATIEIKGKYAYGFLKKETGVHRLVRISPFSAKDLRHTSFALVEVLPEIGTKDRKDFEIKDTDIRIETLRSSGPGGQNVNKRETAVRIIHIPTNISVSCQSERTQGLNKEKALNILYSKLLQKREEERKKEMENLKGKQVLAEWGNQIRSYVIHPYKQVKDLRTGVETSNVEDVLNGKIDKFIAEEIKLI